MQGTEHAAYGIVPPTQTLLDRVRLKQMQVRLTTGCHDYAVTSTCYIKKKLICYYIYMLLYRDAAVYIVAYMLLYKDAVIYAECRLAIAVSEMSDHRGFANCVMWKFGASKKLVERCRYA